MVGLTKLNQCRQSNNAVRDNDCSQNKPKSDSISDRPGTIWASTRENLSSGVCEQHRRRPACTSAQSDQRLCFSTISLEACHKRTFNYLASLCSRGDWFESRFFRNSEDRFCHGEAHLFYSPAFVSYSYTGFVLSVIPSVRLFVCPSIMISFPHDHGDILRKKGYNFTKYCMYTLLLTRPRL